MPERAPSLRGWLVGTAVLGAISATACSKDSVVEPSPADVGAAVELALGRAHTCSRLPGGAMLCWGDNTRGQLGDGTMASRATPTRVTGLDGSLAQIALGDSHTCARATDGSVRCWGGNEAGQLGDGTTNDRPSPTRVSGLDLTVVEVSLGNEHTCARMNDGTVRCWGNNDAGQLGVETTETCAGSSGGPPLRCSRRPMAVPALSGVVQIAVNGQHSCARTGDGTVRCWGSNQFGQLGVPTTETCAKGLDCSTKPLFVAGLSGVAQLALGSFYSCARKVDGTVLCWGRNVDGQLAVGSEGDKGVPTLLPSIAGAAQIACGDGHSCVRGTDGTLFCWGQNGSGQRGDGRTETTEWQSASRLQGPVDIALGHLHTCARTPEGTVFCWGSNQARQLGVKTTGKCGGGSDCSTMPLLVPQTP